MKCEKDISAVVPSTDAASNEADELAPLSGKGKKQRTRKLDKKRQKDGASQQMSLSKDTDDKVTGSTHDKVGGDYTEAAYGECIVVLDLGAARPIASVAPCCRSSRTQ